MEFRSSHRFFFAISSLLMLVPLRAETVMIGFPGAGIDATELIQTALDGCVAGDEVRLGVGVYEISSQLRVGNGVTLVGEGREKTVLLQTSDSNRVMTIDGGARVERVTLTGGRISGKNYAWGGGVCVMDGTVSWCCVSNNTISCSGHNIYGGGIGFPEHGRGRVDHTLIVDNVCRSGGGTLPEGYGGGVGVFKPDGEITIDTCLIRGNVVVWTPGHTGCGGGVGMNNVGQPVVIRNVTIVGNRAGEDGAVTEALGAAVCVNNNYCKQNLEMYNCIIADNETENDAGHDVSLPSDSVVDYCLFDNAGDCLGGKSLTGGPLFKNPAAGKFTLTARSPAYKAGMTYPGIGKDLAGVDFAKRPSMGCYEFTNPGFRLVVR